MIKVSEKGEKGRVLCIKDGWVGVVDIYNKYHVSLTSYMAAPARHLLFVCSPLLS